MSDPTEQPQDEPEQNLVAYLDGELDGDTAREVEAELSRSATVRKDADTLKKTWDLLDYLPRPQASQAFTHRTLEKLDAIRVTATVRQQRWRRWGKAAWAASVAAAGLLGFWVTYSWPTAQPQPSPEELRVLEFRGYWPYFLQSDSVDLLRELDQPDLFGEET